MRVILVAAAFAALAASAHAQETTGTAPASVPASSCPAFVTAPAPPDGASATPAQVTTAVAEFETWRQAAQATLDCRAAEVRALAAQGEARRTEYIAAQADNQTRAAAFQAQLDIFAARPQPRRTAR